MSKFNVPLMRIESLKEGVVLALDQLRANKFRSVLTIIGIVVGVATVMWMSAMVTGIRSGIMTELEAAGPKNFFFARYNWNEVKMVSDGPPWGDNPKVTVEEVLALRRLPAVKEAIPGVDGSGSFEFGKERVASVNIAGRGSGWTAYTTGTMIAGHDFMPNDVAAGAPVAVLSEELAATLFGPLDPVNRTFRINGQAFRVSGVFRPARNIFASIMKNYAVIPYTAGLKHLDFDDDMITGLIVTAPQASQEEAIDQVTAYLRTSRGVHPSADNNFAVIKQEEMAKTFNKITGIFFMVMIALSSVALMVGGVGVIAIMMIAVTERTREIGIRKALGATQREILWQFLFESVTVTVIGGAIGMMMGGLGALLVTVATPIDAKVPIGGVIAALGMATVAGVLFGLWPAWRAARMDPVVALRYE